MRVGVMVLVKNLYETELFDLAIVALKVSYLKYTIFVVVFFYILLTSFHWPFLRWQSSSMCFYYFIVVSKVFCTIFSFNFSLYFSFFYMFYHLFHFYAAFTRERQWSIKVFFFYILLYVYLSIHNFSFCLFQLQILGRTWKTMAEKEVSND